MKLTESFRLTGQSLPKEIEAAYWIVHDLQERGLLTAGLSKEDNKKVIWELDTNKRSIDHEVYR